MSLVEIELQRVCRFVEVDVGRKGYIDAVQLEKNVSIVVGVRLA